MFWFIAFSSMLFFSITVNIILIWIIFGKEWWIKFYCLNSSEQVTPRWGQFQTTSWPVSALLTWACVSSTVLLTLSTSSQSNHFSYTADQIWIILVNLRNWVLGLGVCRLTTFMSYFTVAVSVFLLLALTLERWDDGVKWCLWCLLHSNISLWNKRRRN